MGTAGGRVASGRLPGVTVITWSTGSMAGRPTSENMVLLCRRHHRMVHEGGWQLIKTADQQVVTIAPTITFGSELLPILPIHGEVPP